MYRVGSTPSLIQRSGFNAVAYHLPGSSRPMTKRGATSDSEAREFNNLFGLFSPLFLYYLMFFFVIFCALKSRRVTHLPSTQESSSERRAPQDGQVETGRTRSNDMS